VTTAWSLLPPLVALGLALGTRRVVPALAAGGLTGTVLLAILEGRPWIEGPIDFVRVGLLGQPSEAANAQMLVLITLVCGFVRLFEVSGAGRALVAALGRGVVSARRAELATWASGLVLFFSDFGNVLILGPTFRSVYDRLGVPRERLAWIIDTTAAPVCVLVPFIAWGVYAAGLIEEAGGGDGFARLLEALPFQAYAWLSLAFVPLMVGLGRPFGPMARAAPIAPEPEAEAAPAPPLSTALLPLAGLFVTLAAVGGTLAWGEGRVTGPTVRTALAAGYLVAIGALWRTPDAGRALREGMGRAAPILALLVLAWTLGEVCGRLGTGPFLAAALSGSLPAWALPATVFVVGAITSFATGTSWGTFAILMPIAVPLATSLGAPLAATIGGVLSGGVFGDHASPLSDTTLIASMAADTDHARHVATQLPYALVVGAATLVTLLAAGLTGSPWALGAGAAMLLLATGATRWP
jgi:Na+/H+ antiporter NhaC